MNRSNGYASGGRPPIDGQTRPPMSQAPSSNQSRAQRFESEKQRIQESCFSKMDESGQQAESYITHLRIEEDGAYPSMPPPVESDPANKKARVIIVAVRSTGRVRVHKARENHNGSFSVGKTWNLEDLTAIESFNYVAPDADQVRRDNCRRAGNLGFVVTIGKPYYWQAGTPKERDFFIASLVKIFRKYTKGRVPELIGFEEHERDQMFGQTPGQTPQPRGPSVESTPGAPNAPFAQHSRPTSRDADPRNRSVSTDKFTPSTTSSTSPGGPPSARRFISQGSPPPQNLEPGRIRYGPSDRPSFEQRRPSEQGLGIRTARSQERLRKPSTEGLNKSDRMRPPEQTYNGRLSPQDSRGELRAPRAVSPVGSQMSTSSRGTATSGKPPVSPLMQRDMSHDARPNGSIKDRWAPVSNQPTPDTNGRFKKPPEPDRKNSSDSRFVPSEDGRASEPQELPERRRPPMAGRNLSSNPTYETDDLKPPPLSTARSASGTTPTSPRLPGAFIETPVGSNLPSPMPSSQRDQSPFQKAAAATKESPSKPESAKDETPKVPSEPPPPPPAATPEIQTPDSERTEDEASRPGLGPMFKKRDVASTFRKAAAAASAFKPRAGGAAERLKSISDGKDEQDGVHGVMPAPLRTANLEASRNNSIVSTPMSEKESPQFSRKGSTNLLEQQTATPQLATPPIESDPDSIAPDALGIMNEAKSENRHAVKPKRRTVQQEKYLASLGFDPALFENRGLEFESILSQFGWDNEILQPNKIDQLEAGIKREIGRVEAGSWLYHVEQKDDRVGLVDRMLDRAIAECDELDGLLTLYSVELGTLNEDIAFIEAQGQGLQVQTANQKILHAELQNLVTTISITPDQLAGLQRASFDSDLDMIEGNLVVLYQALLTIDPTVKSTTSFANRGSRVDNPEQSELASMHALQEKRDMYLEESDRFCHRLVSRLGSAFDVSLQQAIPTLLKPSASGRSAPWNLHPAACNAARAGLWQYSPLILYTKEVNQPAWRHLLNAYADIARPLYATVFKTALDAHKKNVRPSAGDEADVLFTTVEKDSSDGLSSTTRKLTMKRSQTLAKATRSTSGEKAKMLQAGRQTPCEAFADMLQEWAPTLAMEQNYVVELFHATSLENLDFVDAVQSAPPEQRRGPPDLLMPRIAEPDRNAADQIQRSMQTVFDFWPLELLKLVDQSTATDPIQAIGMMASVAVFSAPLHETSQEFLLRSLSDAAGKLEGIFHRFIDAQIHAIEDTKVLLKKRKGVINFIRTFPHFSMAVENVFTGAARSAGNNPAVGEVRRMVNDAYERINQAMWIALKQIAKDSPTIGTSSHGPGAGQGTEAEDKEVLNFHILLIENMNHYIEEVDDGGDEQSVLAVWRGKALMERAEHLDQYVKRVVRRPLGKLLDFIESTESLMSHAPNPTSIAAKPSHARSAAKRALSPYDGKEIRKGIDALRKRVEKHFGESSGDSTEERAVAQKLVGVVLDECEREYLGVLERTQKIIAEVYSNEEKGLEVDWAREDVLGGFRR
ncbi:Exocyst complex component 1 [Sphaceloma murrayae]|uniref:Exocyst complex component 1 n=1 Tax=Sphaceloma murrayae TaxID=2082308 RepID=A0A2K1QNQ8_9PEZI|nr:Exocyst complex component 1 [Sphaceloma murrayae]